VALGVIPTVVIVNTECGVDIPFGMGSVPPSVLFAQPSVSEDDGLTLNQP
jgi:hypothetical protein